jgi:hypothetical protein
VQRRPAEAASDRCRRYNSADSENPERPEIEHFGNCSICGALVDVRALAQVMARMHVVLPIDLTGKPDPDLQ